MWKSYWKLASDPFQGSSSSYVPTPGHEEAVARLVHTVENLGRLATVRSSGGLGKTTVVSRAIAELKGPARRISRVDGPADGSDLLARLATGLGIAVPVGSSRALAWRSLGDAVRLCGWQKVHAILVVDDAQNLHESADRRDLERLVQLDPRPSARLTVIRAFREMGPRPETSADWTVAIRLRPLTGIETGLYVREKLIAGGRTEPVFTPKALRALHQRSGGIPLAIDRLAPLALMAGSVLGREMVTPDVIEGVARECDVPFPDEFAA